jgi:glycosyltransferase involved in cell wall biosynthesis
MCCGCPVLVSDIPVLREVCQDAAIYFNPLDINNIRSAIEHFLSLKDTERAAMQERGLTHAAHFSWEQAAKAIVALS